MSRWITGWTLSALYFAVSSWPALAERSSLPFQLDTVGTVLPFEPDLCLGVGLVYRDTPRYRARVDFVEHRLGWTPYALKVPLTEAIEISVGPTAWWKINTKEFEAGLTFGRILF